MGYMLITPTGAQIQFCVEECANVFMKCFGGEVHRIINGIVE